MIGVLVVLGCGSAADRLEVRTLGGGLGRAATILTARHRVSFNFEGVPRDLAGISFEATLGPGGVEGHRMIYPELHFSYPPDASPREIAEAAVAAWNVLPVDGHHRVVQETGMIHLVPYERRTPDGRYVPFTPLLDTVLQLERTVGTPTDLYRHVLAELVETSGVQVEDGMEGFGLGNVIPPVYEDRTFRSQELVTLPSSTGTARSLLDALMVLADRETNWILLWVLDEVTDSGASGHWTFLFTVATPDEESENNGTPLLPSR